MKNLLRLSWLVALTTGIVVPVWANNTLSAEEKADGWQLLFDGKSTSTWHGFQTSGFPELGWVVEDGL